MQLAMAIAAAAGKGVLWGAVALLTVVGGLLRAAPSVTPAAGAVDTAARSDQAARPSTPQYFKSWAVGCDNVLRCEAVSLLAEDSGQGESGSSGTISVELQIVREGGPAGPLEIHARSVDPLPDRMRLVADGREIARLDSRNRPEPGTDGAQALAAARTMANAVTIELLDRKKRRLAVISTEGLADSLRFMDARQGRAGSVTALVARGNQPASAVTPVPAVPRIRQVPSPDADSVQALALSEVQAARAIARCDASLAATEVKELYPLDAATSLVLLPCEAGAYNLSVVPLLAKGVAGARTMSIARFDHPPGFTGEPGKPPLVVNPLWDARRGVLSSLAKGRGVGDCGASEAYVWDGAMFRLVESRAMHVCRGASEWIRLWTATPDRAEVAARAGA